MSDTTVDDEIPCRVSKGTKGRLEFDLFVAIFEEVNLEDAEGFDMSEVNRSGALLSLDLYGGEELKHRTYVDRTLLLSFVIFLHHHLNSVSNRRLT